MTALERVRDALDEAESEQEAAAEALADAEKDVAAWKQIASDNAEIIAAARTELARWSGLDAMTGHDAFEMRDALRRALGG